MQAGFDQKATEREAKLKETMANLQRIFPGLHTPMADLIKGADISHIPGVRGRLVDLCKPTQRKYETAISVILGRNIDAVVVDEERTAIDCIEVCHPSPFHSALPGGPICYSIVHAEPARGPGNVYSS